MSFSSWPLLSSSVLPAVLDSRRWRKAATTIIKLSAYSPATSHLLSFWSTPNDLVLPDLARKVCPDEGTTGLDCYRVFYIPCASFYLAFHRHAEQRTTRGSRQKFSRPNPRRPEERFRDSPPLFTYT